MTFNKLALALFILFITLCFLGGSYSIGKGIYFLKNSNRTVTVKGLAEQNVKSDLAIWEIDYRETGNDLVALDAKVQQDEKIVIAFLKEQGFTDNEMGRAQLRVEDKWANNYDAKNTNLTHYVVTAGIFVRTSKVDQVNQATQVSDKLLQQGVPVAFDASNLSPNPSYYYTTLDAIRPSMMAAATKSARIVAEQFAQDSDSKLGRIQHASQGQFQIMNRDTSTMSSDWNSNQNALGSIDKKVRLVTTIDYRLR